MIAVVFPTFGPTWLCSMTIVGDSLVNIHIHTQSLGLSSGFTCLDDRLVNPLPDWCAKYTNRLPASATIHFHINCVCVRVLCAVSSLRFIMCDHKWPASRNCYFFVCMPTAEHDYWLIIISHSCCTFSVFSTPFTHCVCVRARCIRALWGSLERWAQFHRNITLFVG